jgi:DNA-binding transcriptional ArsR family regulator
MESSQIDLVFKALSHPERRRILAFLHGQPDQSLFAICAASFAEDGQALSRQTISQHLDALEAAGLVETLWKGRTKAHAINLHPLRQAVGLSIRRYL